MATKGGFPLSNFRGFAVEDLVARPGPDVSVHVFSVQLLPCLLGVLDSSLKKKRRTWEPNLRWSVLFITLGPRMSIVQTEGL